MEFRLEKEPSQVEPTCYVEVEESSSTEDSKEETEISEKIVAGRSVEEPVIHRSSRISQRQDLLSGECVLCQKQP